MQDEATLLRNFMQRRRLSQAALAQKAGVSQATVSRALAGKKARHGSARQKLFTYAGIGGAWSSAKGHERVMAAFEAVWDHTEAHANAIARVIQALADLEPRKRTSAEPEE